MNKQTILLYGRSNAGKTCQIGELAEYVKKTTGKNTRLATADRGGIVSIQPYVDVGIIEPVEMGDTEPAIFLNKVVRGYVRDDKGKWVPGKNDNIGLFAFESLRAVAEAIMGSLVKKVADGGSIGGGANVSLSVTGDGETLKISGSNMAMFGICQSRVTEEVWESQKLNAPYILWTSSVSKDDDTTSVSKVLGPDMIGKALTAEIPRWFTRTFRIDVVPAQGAKPERHILYLGTSVDTNSGNAMSLGNVRMPLDGDALPATIEPASIVKALELVNKGGEKAKEVISKRLGLVNV